MRNGYLLIDIGTGNYRVCLVGTDGTEYSLHRKDMFYEKSQSVEGGVFFNPHTLLVEIKKMINLVISENYDVSVLAVLSTSQRQGVVLIDASGEAITALPNIDGRGAKWEVEGPDFDYVYKKTGRWPRKNFSALKLKGMKEEQPAIWDKVASFTSISDWIGYELTNELVYEHTQACETLLFDVQKDKWSAEMCEYFDIDIDLLPKLGKSGSVLGNIKEECLEELSIPDETPFIIGGADTQLALKATQPKLDDVVIVSGTTTPIVRVVEDYYYDEKARCWIDRHIENEDFLIEANAAVTGLNYQRLKNLLFPQKSYEEMENEVLALEHPTSIASFGTAVSDKQMRLSMGGFLLEAPFNQNLQIADLVFAMLFDIASSIKYNFDVLHEIKPVERDYVLGSSGGFQSKILPQMLADLLDKKVIIKEGYNQATLLGGVFICNNVLGKSNKEQKVIKEFKPSGSKHLLAQYDKWLNYRNEINDL